MPANREARRIKRVWERLVQAYGSRLGETYGPTAPAAWVEAIEALSDDQIAYGLRRVIRESVNHPPNLGQFLDACEAAPKPHSTRGPSTQEVLCEFAMLAYFRKSKYTADQTRQISQPWTFLYREWTDDTRVKHLQRCAECTGVVIPAVGAEPAIKLMAIDMQADPAMLALAQSRLSKSWNPPRAERA